MNVKTKRGVVVLAATALCTALLLVFVSFSRGQKTGAKTVFADTSPAVQIPADSLAAAEALQGAFRSVSDKVLPAVVELDVVETKTVESSPFDSLPFFFFGTPRQNDSPKEYSQQGLGSGVIVRKTGNLYYVLTNHHVAGSATDISVKLYDGRENWSVPTNAKTLLWCRSKQRAATFRLQNWAIRTKYIPATSLWPWERPWAILHPSRRVSSAQRADPAAA